MSRWGTDYADECVVDGIVFKYRAVPHFPSEGSTDPAHDVEPDAVLCIDCVPDPRDIGIDDMPGRVRSAIEADARRRRYYGGQSWPLKAAWPLTRK